jgi:dUTP pyrophosphatase
MVKAALSARRRVERGTMDIAIKILSHGKLPYYPKPDAAALECFASEPAIIPAHGRAPVQLGFVIAIPDGHVGIICSLSGPAVRDDIYALPRTLDPAYRSPASILLVNVSPWPVEIETGMRVCQLVIVPTAKVNLVKVGDQNEAHRRSHTAPTVVIPPKGPR